MKGTRTGAPGVIGLVLLLMGVALPSLVLCDQEMTFITSGGEPVGAVSPPVGKKTPAKWTLDTLVDEAVSKNPQILSRRYFSASAASAVDSAYWQFFPSPYMQFQQVGNNDPALGVYDRTYTVGLQQPVWTGGRLTSNYALAKSQAKSAEFSLAEAKYNLALQVLSVYQAFMQSQQRGAAQVEGNRRLEGFVEMIKRRVANGVSAQADLSLVESRLSQGVSDLSILKSMQSTSLVKLGQLVGRSVAAEDIEVSYGTNALPARFTSEELYGIVKKHPMLLRYDAEVEVASQQLEVQKSSLWPSLSVKAEYQNGLFTQEPVREAGRVYLNVSYSPGAGLSTYSDIKGGRAKVSGQKEVFEVARRELLAQIAADYNDCVSSFVRLKVATHIVVSSREVLESYKRMFIAGKRSWLDVLNAARELTQTEQQMADAQALFVASEYRLQLYAGNQSWSYKEKN